MTNTPTIIITEDDEASAHLIETNLKRSGLDFRIIRAHNGKEAVDIIEHKNDSYTFTSEDRLVMLLDIRMPKMDGIQVLEHIKQSQSLKKIPVIMLTTTDDPKEIDKCYDLGCNFYVTKPVDYGKFITTIKSVAEYLKVCTIPEFSGP